MSQNFLGVHLVGSMQATDVDESFQFVGKTLAPWIKRVSDGAMAPEQRWLFSEGSLYYASDDFEQVTGEDWMPITRVRLKQGRDPATAKLGTLRYAEYARRSFELFSSRKSDGTLAPETRFQICIPTPDTSLTVLVDEGSQAAVRPIHERELRASLDEIFDSLPQSELAVQWDVVAELRAWCDMPDIAVRDGRSEVIGSLAELTSWVPSDVELGFHLCFGDKNARMDMTFKPVQADGLVSVTLGLDSHDRIDPARPVPGGMQALAAMTLAIVDAAPRPVDFIHFPIGPAVAGPIDREFAALKPLRAVAANTEIYLGVLDLANGLPTSRRYVEAASAVLDRFGIAPECGLGRVDPAEQRLAFDMLVELSTELSDVSATAS